MPNAVWTIGHSTRSFEEFVRVLETHEIEAVADVRRFPGSRRLPQFGSAALESALVQRGIAYAWLPELGGRRRTRSDSSDSAWRNASFRAYAGHLNSDEFASGLFDLLTVAQGLRTAVMCAELLWWRCHRRLIADVLVSLGIDVLHIVDTRPAEPHRIIPPARILDGTLTYAGGG